MLSPTKKRQKAFHEEGLEAILRFKTPAEPNKKRIVDGKIEAFIIATACGAPPEGFGRWTIRSITNKIQLDPNARTTAETYRYQVSHLAVQEMFLTTLPGYSRISPYQQNLHPCLLLIIALLFMMSSSLCRKFPYCRLGSLIPLIFSFKPSISIHFTSWIFLPLPFKKVNAVALIFSYFLFTFFKNYCKLLIIKLFG